MTNRENALIALNGEKGDRVPCFYDSCQIVRAICSGEAPPFGTAVGVDGWGVSQSSCAEAGGAFTATVGVPPVLQDLELWEEQIKFPTWDEEVVRKTAEKEYAMFGYDKKNYVQDMFGGKGMLERFHFLRGFEDALCDLVSDPDIVSEIAGRIADKKIEFLRLAAKYYDLDYYTYMDDYAHQNGQFMSLDTFREVFKPHYQRIIDAAHELGLKFKTHCCGMMEPFLEELMGMGIDALDPVQPLNNVPAMLKKTVGKIGISGGLDVQHVVDDPDATEEDIRREVRRCIDEYGQNGGYMIYGASLNMYDPNRFEPGRPLWVVCDEAEKYGKL